MYANLDYNVGDGGKAMIQIFGYTQAAVKGAKSRIMERIKNRLMFSVDNKLVDAMVGKGGANITYARTTFNVSCTLQIC